MKILLVHNHYQQPGGEDQVFADEAKLLESHGHEVFRFTQHNDAIRDLNHWKLAAQTIWNHSLARQLRHLVRRHRPEVVHFHNTFPLISPAAYYAVRREGAAVVQTLHNFRLLCPNAVFFRDGKICEDCMGKVCPWPGIIHRCYRHHRLATTIITLMLTTHRSLGTWQKAVDLYIALTETGRRKFIAGGLPADKIVVKPNFLLADPGAGSGGGGYALFVGRLTPEKGVKTLLQAWNLLGKSIPLKIVGDGPMADTVRQAASHPGVQWLGWQSPAEVLRLLGQAMFLVFPSEWYEGLPRIIVESFATGTPVLASNCGAMLELVKPGRTGFHFQAANPSDLAAQVRHLLAHGETLATVRAASRQEFLARYSADCNYPVLQEIYAQAIHRFAESSPPPPKRTEPV